jgi:hypothetical protein
MAERQLKQFINIQPYSVYVDYKLLNKGFTESPHPLYRIILDYHNETPSLLRICRLNMCSIISKRTCLEIEQASIDAIVLRFDKA